MIKPVYYNQKDPRWKDTLYPSVSDKNVTIGHSGCGPTCAAMVIATLRDPKVTPVDTCAWASKYNYHTAGTEQAYFKPQMEHYGIPCELSWYLDKALSALESGLMVISLAKEGLWTSGGHYILAYGLDGENVLVNDPNSELEIKSHADISYFRRETKPWFIIKEEWNVNLEKIIEEMTPEQAYAIFMKSQKHAATLPASTYAIESCKKAVKSGLFSDGDKNLLLDNPRAALSREEFAVVLDRANILDNNDGR